MCVVVFLQYTKVKKKNFVEFCDPIMGWWLVNLAVYRDIGYREDKGLWRTE